MIKITKTEAAKLADELALEARTQMQGVGTWSTTSEDVPDALRRIARLVERVQRLRRHAQRGGK